MHFGLLPWRFAGIVTDTRRGRVNRILKPVTAPLPSVEATGDIPMAYTLETAAEAAKVTEPTVLKWIKAGKISAMRAEDDTDRIEPAELRRSLDSAAKDPLPAAAPKPDSGISAVAAGADSLSELTSLRSEVGKLNASPDVERQRTEDARQRTEEVKTQPDRWTAQAERLALPASEKRRNGSGRPWTRRA
jgi:hypothetical protein